MNRREFLGAAGGSLAAVGVGAASGCAAAGGQAPVASAAGRDGAAIARIALYPVRYPMTGYFKFFTGPHGGAGRAAVLVEITAEDGTVGWGQSVPIAKWSDETLETATVALREYFAPALQGLTVATLDDIATAHRALDAAIAPGFSTGMPIARAGLDIALHDLIARRAGVPVAALWGRKAEGRLTLSWTINVQQLDDVDGLVAAGRARGYRHFNIKVGPDPTFDAALAKAVRRAAPEAFLWADANGGYALDAALRAAPALAAAGVDVLESPLRPNRLAGYRELKRQGALPILMDEGVTTVDDLREFHQLGMLDGVAMKPSRCGGLMSCRAQIEYCELNGLLWLGSGLTDPDLSLAATLQLFAAYGLRKPAALNGPQFLTADALRAPIAVVDGEIVVPAGPGLGVEVDRDKLRALAG